MVLINSNNFPTKPLLTYSQSIRNDCDNLINLNNPNYTLKPVNYLFFMNNLSKEQEAMRKKQEEDEKMMKEILKERKKEEWEAKQQYKAEMFAKYNTTNWDVVKRKKQEEYEERCEKRKQREREKEEWWKQNKDRIEAERERCHQEYLHRKADRMAKSRAAAGKPIPGAWRTANRPDGW
jgi:hypothetical protein